MVMARLMATKFTKTAARSLKSPIRHPWVFHQTLVTSEVLKEKTIAKQRNLACSLLGS